MATDELPSTSLPHFVFCKVLGPVPPPLTGIHTRNAVNELVTGVAHKPRLGCAPQARSWSMSQRLPEQPLNSSDEANIPGSASIQTYLGWYRPATHLLDVDLHLGQDCGPPDSLRRWPPRFEGFWVLTSGPHRTHPSCWGLRIF